MDAQDFLNQLCDRNSNVLDAVETFVDSWGCDVDSRKPRRFQNEDGTETMELDMAALLVTLAKNKTIINLPRYRNSMPTQVREDEVVVSKDNRHGPVIGVSSHAKVGSLGFLIRDHNVMTATGVGGFRTYNFIGPDGTVRDDAAWQEIQIYQEDGTLADTIRITHPVAPGRCTSLYGRQYLIAKAAIMRLMDEQKAANANIKTLRTAPPATWNRSQEVGESAVMQVRGFEVVVDNVTLHGDYCLPNDFESAEQHLSRIKQNLRTLRFLTRATELAFLQYGIKSDAIQWVKGEGGDVMVPGWAASADWSTGFKPPKGKLCWAKFDSFLGLSVRFRAWTENHKVSAEEVSE